jgi:hypothetical protein
MSPLSVKYVIHPGMVRSMNDGQYHYIGFRQLVDLYCVDPRWCINVNNMHGHLINDPRITYVHLYPRESGNYTSGH